MKKYISLVLEFAIVACVIAGVTLTAVMASGGFMGGATAILYFTVQSNIWIGATALVAAVFTILSIVRKRNGIPRALWIVKYVFTVSITLTGVVFCGVLAPTMPDAFAAPANILTHVAVPVLSIADFFVGEKGNLEYKEFLYSWIPPLYYLIFAGIGYALNWDFGMGNNYPYFFLNWDSPAGAFGFADGMYFMGTFYWIIALIIFISALALAYIAIIREIVKKRKN